MKKRDVISGYLLGVAFVVFPMGMAAAFIYAQGSRKDPQVLGDYGSIMVIISLSLLIVWQLIGRKLNIVKLFDELENG